MPDDSLKSLVIDTSIAVQWIVKDEQGASIDKLFLAGYLGKSSLHVPALWLWECGNALLSYCKAGRILATDIEDYLSALRYPKPHIDALPSVATQKTIFEIAQQSKLSFYDATYLELALRRRAGLATLDKKLRAAATAQGVVCIDL